MRVCLGMLRTCSIYRPEVGINRESNWNRRRQKAKQQGSKYKVKWRLASCSRHRCTSRKYFGMIGSFTFMSGTKWHWIGFFLPDGKKPAKLFYVQKMLWFITMPWQTETCNEEMLHKYTGKLNCLLLCVISTCVAFAQTTHEDVRVQIKWANLLITHNLKKNQRNKSKTMHSRCVLYLCTFSHLKCFHYLIQKHPNCYAFFFVIQITSCCRVYIFFFYPIHFPENR